MDPEHVRLVERLRAVQTETAAAYSKAESFLVRVPLTRLAVQECTVDLQSAEQAFDEFRTIAMEMQHRLEVVTTCTQQLLDELDVPPDLSPRGAPLPGSLGGTLERELLELEEQHVVLLRGCQKASRDAIGRADQTHFRMKQGLALQEHQADICGRFLDDSSHVQESARDRWDQRIEQLACDLEAIQESGSARAQAAELARSELATARLEWLAEREELLRDAARWEAELTEARACVGQEEAEAEHAARWQRSELAASRAAAARTAEVRRATELARGRAEGLVAEAREVADQRRAMRERVEEERGAVALLATRLAIEGLAAEAGVAEPLAQLGIGSWVGASDGRSAVST